MEQVPSSHFSKGQEVIKASRRRTCRKSAPVRVGYPRSRGPIRPVTGWPSLSPTSFTPRPVSLPCGRATTGVGDVGLTQLPIEKNGDGVVGTYAPVDRMSPPHRRVEQSYPRPVLVPACQPLEPDRLYGALWGPSLAFNRKPSFPGPPPLRGWQGTGHCRRGSGPRITRWPARVGTPGHRRVRRDCSFRHFSTNLSGRTAWKARDFGFQEWTIILRIFDSSGRERRINERNRR